MSHKNLRKDHLIRVQNTELKALKRMKNLERLRLKRDDQKAGKSFQGRNVKGFGLITCKNWVLDDDDDDDVR